MKKNIIIFTVIVFVFWLVIALFSSHMNDVNSVLLSAKEIGKDENYPIDLVYLWCEDNPQREKLRNEWREKLGIMKNKNTNSLQATNKGRFVSNDELRYSLRSVEKYAPWINKIYIVTDSQVPKWLNLNHPKIRIIDHKDIMPSSMRPNFSSVAIEHCISNIKNLSEHFLYANDDMMFGDYVWPEDFFKSGKPIYILDSRIFSFIQRIYAKITGDFDIKDSQYGKTIVNAYTLVNKQPGGLSMETLRYPHHNIDPYLKSTMQKTKEVFKNDMKPTINFRFRSDEDIQRMIYTFYALYVKEAYYKVKKSHDYISYYVGINHIDRLPKELEKHKYKMFCTNDGESTSDNDRMKYKDIMERIFPDKSSFEK